MHLRNRIIAAAFAIALGTSGAGATTIFVRAAASGANNGTSWTDAYTSLQTALAAAVSTDEIWVAAGVYKPTATADRMFSFTLKNGVGVYGGFAGTETMRSQRNPDVNVTALSGDIGSGGVTTDNSYHVVTSDNTVTATGILDGFTITGGRADGVADPVDRGGGLYVNGGSPTFARCTFSTNYASNRGAGVRVAAGSPSFTDCRFLLNISETAGAGLSAGSVGSMKVTACAFRNNAVNNPTGGGGIEATDNTTVVDSILRNNSPNGANFLGGNNSFINSTVVNNSAYGLVFFSSPNTIVNSILYGNSTGSIFLGFSGIVTVSYTDVQGGGFAGAGNIDADPLFVNPPSDLRLAAGSPGVDAGNNAAVPVGVTTDVAGLPRFFDDPAAPNTGSGTPPLVDMGAHERVPLSISAPSPASQTVCAGASASFSVTATGSPPLSYVWRKGGVVLSNGGSISGATTTMLTINPTAPGDSGSYDAVVTDGFGQGFASSAATLTVNAIPATPTASNNGPICTGQTLQLSASTIAGATYSWTGPNSFTSSAQNPSIASATAAAAGTYNVTATVNACTSAAGTTNAVVNPTPSAVITALSSVCPSTGGHAASVPDAGVGATYTWTIMNGTITGGAGTRSITFTSGATGSVTLGVTVQAAGGCSAMSSKMVTILPPGCPGKFFTLVPCRVVDTRGAVGPWGGPALAAGASREFTIVGRCAIPASARSVSLNVTVVQPTTSGYFTLYPGGTQLPLVSVLNYAAGQIKANNAVTPLGEAGTLSVFCGQGSGTAHLLIDVNGYFE